MAIIYSYPRIYTVNEEQLLLISDNRTGKPTKNIGVGDLAAFITTDKQIQDFKLYNKSFCPSVTLTGNDLIMYSNGVWCKGSIGGGSYIEADYSVPGIISLDLSATGLGIPKSDYFLRGDNTWSPLSIPSNIVETFSSESGVFINVTNNVNASGNVTIGTVDLSATGLGSPTENYFLRGDNTWAEVSLDVNYESTLNPSLAIINDIGGFTAGTTVGDLLGTPLSSMWDTLLFPALPPVYKNPTISTTESFAGFAEIGETIVVPVTIQFVNKDSGGFDTGTMTLNRGGTPLGPLSVSTALFPPDILPQYGEPNPNNPQEKTTGTFTETFVFPTPTSGLTRVETYTGAASYLTGQELKNSLGQLSPPAIAAGTISNTATVRGYYPYFWGLTTSVWNNYATAVAEVVGRIQNPADPTVNKVVNNSSGQLNIAFNGTAGVDFMWFATPEAATTKTKWFETALNNGDIGGTDFADPNRNLFSSPDINAITTTLWGPVNYKIYVALKSSTTTTLQIKNN